MDRTYPKVNIVILNYNGKNFLKKCLASVFRIDYPNFETVVVDNNSKDGSFEEAKSNFSRVTFIKNEENIGFSAGNNIGIKYSLEKMAEYVLLLNNDTEVDRDFLNYLVDEAEKNKQAGIFSPFVYRNKTREVWFSGGHIDWLRMKTVHNTNVINKEKSFETGFISGCAMMIRADVFRKIGLLDEEFFLYWEDADFSTRARKEDFSLLMIPQSKVWHFEQSEDNKPGKIYWLVLSGLIFFYKNSSFWMKLWTKLYVFFRRVKNKKKLKKISSDKIAIEVKKAYDDFSFFKKKSKK